MTVVRIIHVRVRAPRIVAAATIRGRRLVEEIWYSIKLMFYFGVCKTFVVAAAATV